MKYIVFLIITLCCLSSNAQTVRDSVCYQYIIAEPLGYILSDKCELRIDDGIKPSTERSERGKKILFKSYAAALMYLTLQGWELVSCYSNIRGHNNVNNITDTYWILRRPSTKEEVERIVNESLIKKNKEQQ